GLQDAQTSAAKARAAIGKGDAIEGARQLESTTDSLARAREATADPVWDAASSVPWIGPNLRAVTALTAALDDLARDGVAPVVDVVTIVASGGLAPKDGRIDLAPLATAAPALEQAAVAGEAASASLAQIDSDALLPMVGEQVDEVRTEVANVASALRTGARVSSLLPAMLGAEGERHYLALFLNSAELRSTGGLVGAMAVITADDGALSMSATRAGTDLPRLDEPVLPLTPAELELHSEALGRRVAGIALTPDFARTAQLAAAMWEADTGQSVDGVVATDVVALAGLLAATGTVTTSDGTELTSETAVAELLHEPYLRYKKQAEADAFFADAAGRVFAKVVAGGGSFSQIIDALATASGEGRVLVWSDDDDEQAGLHTAGISGAFLSGAAPSAGGIFLNDATGGKLDYFLDAEVDVARVVCEDGGMRVGARLRLASRVPADVADLPEYVTGVADVPKGSFITRVSAYGPAGGSLFSTKIDGAAVGGRQGVEEERDVNVLSVELAPGQSVSYEIEWFVPRVGPVEVWSTPTTTSSGRLRVPGSCA
ncbi:MAG: DUF4012 domain-containing protein, partial [Actinomycetota bacterium]|nr:DUF4012 domain-containing protein [Actinomycetota bacterium]